MENCKKLIEIFCNLIYIHSKVEEGIYYYNQVQFKILSDSIDIIMKDGRIINFESEDYFGTDNKCSMRTVSSFKEIQYKSSYILNYIMINGIIYDLEDTDDIFQLQLEYPSFSRLFNIKNNSNWYIWYNPKYEDELLKSTKEFVRDLTNESRNH